jgi:hypothetical protein
VESYIVDWLNLGIRWLTRSNKGAHPLVDPPIQFDFVSA